MFSPETYQNFSKSDQTISGFRETQRGFANNIKVGDRFVCYVTRLSRWVGILEVTSNYFEDSKPIFVENNDPFSIRFRVKPLIWLSLENSVPIHENIIWDTLSFTKGLKKNDTRWTGRVRGSLTALKENDGKCIEELLLSQKKQPKVYPLSESDLKKLKTLKVKTTDNKEVTVVVPEKEEEQNTTKEQISSLRESLKIQATLAEIGERMNLKIWLPRNDRSRILEI